METVLSFVAATGAATAAYLMGAPDYQIVGFALVTYGFSIIMFGVLQ